MEGGSAFLSKFNYSLKKALQTAYADIVQTDWKEKREFNFWTSKEKRRNFLTKLEKELDIRVPSDWGKVTTAQIAERGMDFMY